MPVISRDDIRYYRDTLTRYGYRADQFGLALAIDKEPSLDEHAAAYVHVTCYATQVRRLYPANGDNTWLMNFEHELGRGLYNVDTGNATLAGPDGEVNGGAADSGKNGIKSSGPSAMRRGSSH